MITTGEYKPIIKGRGFDPSPIRRYGIPDIADSIQNPSVVGTIGHEDFWNEQIDRCLNGYLTGGILIPGRYYYYLNYCYLHTLGRGYHLPDFTDTDLQFFRLVDHVKRPGGGIEERGIICDKRRRVGRSHVMAALFSYGCRFIPGGYDAGVVSGLSDYSEGFYQKFKDDNSKKPPEFKLHTLHDNFDNWVAGYKLKGKRKDGSFNTIYCRTAQSNENVFKGKKLNDCGFEEAGEFKNIIKTYGATKSCFFRGMDMIGTPYVWGTGGSMGGSKGFKSMLDAAADYGLVPFDIFGPRMLFPFYIGATNENDDVEEDCPNLMSSYEHLQPEQILGCEDLKNASKAIMAEADRLRVAKNLQPYYDHLQNFPMNRQQMFLNFTANPFSPERIADQAYQCSLLPYNKYKKYLLDWKRDKDGEIILPRSVERRLAPDDTPEDQCVLMLEDAVVNLKDLDVAGVDSYDQDKSSTSNSLGSMVVVRRQDIESRNIIRRPICLVRMRPKRKEDFYDTCLKVAFYYNLKKNVLIDVEKALIIKHFEDNDGRKFLAERPKSFESQNSEQTHKWGVRFTPKSKPMMIALIQSWVYDDIDQCWFPIINTELSEYNVGITGTDSDWDAVDALGMALMRIVDMRRPVRQDEKDTELSSDMPIWQNVGGRMIDISLIDKNGNLKSSPDTVGNFYTTGADVEEGVSPGFRLTTFQ